MAFQMAAGCGDHVSQILMGQAHACQHACPVILAEAVAEVDEQRHQTDRS
jgi:hypothetical protein